MTADEWAIAGIVVTILIGVPAFFAVKKVRSNRQDQKVGPGGKGYQAGRDMNIKGDEN